MPRVPQYLRDEFHNDAAAWAVLEKNFVNAGGVMIIRKDFRYTPTDQENRAIDYLWLEWDYAYE